MLRKIIYYLNPLTLFKKDEEPKSGYTKMMHGINRITILVFIIGLIIMAYKYL